MVKRRIVRVAGAEKTFPVRLREKRNGRQEPERVCIPAREIEVATYVEMLEIGKAGHEIVGDRPAWRKFTQHLDLNALEISNGVGSEPPEIEGVGWIGVRGGARR
jgi:hypothetical protein